MKKSVQQYFEEQAREVVEAEIRNFRPNVKKMLESSVLSLIGLEKKYNGDYEIDHCNGRVSLLTGVFQSIAKEEAEKIASSYKPTKEDIAGFREAFAREYKRQMDYQMREIAREKAKKDLTAFMERNAPNIESVMAMILNKK